MFEIPAMLSDMRSDYHFYLRNHTWVSDEDSWPGSFFCESVLYAV